MIFITIIIVLFFITIKSNELSEYLKDILSKWNAGWFSLVRKAPEVNVLDEVEAVPFSYCFWDIVIIIQESCAFDGSKDIFCFCSVWVIVKNFKFSVFVYFYNSQSLRIQVNVRVVSYSFFLMRITYVSF